MINPQSAIVLWGQFNFIIFFSVSVYIHKGKQKLKRIKFEPLYCYVVRTYTYRRRTKFVSGETPCVITNGIVLGCISYVVLMVCRKRAAVVATWMYVLAGMFALMLLLSAVV